MPSTLISLRRERPLAERRQIIETVQAALIEALKIPESDRCLRLRVFGADDFIVKPTQTENFTLVEIDLFAGRTLPTKKKLYQAIVRRLGEFGIAPLDVKILLREIPADNWGIRGGIPASEVDLGFEIKL